MDCSRNTTPSRRKRSTTQQRKVPVTVTCLCCNKSFDKASLQLGSKTKILCSGLSKHIASKDECYQYYKSNYLNKKNGKFDYLPSLSARDKQEHREHLMSKRIKGADLDPNLTDRENRFPKSACAHPQYYMHMCSPVALISSLFCR